MSTHRSAPQLRFRRLRVRDAIGAAAFVCLALFGLLLWHVHHSLEAGPAITASYLAAEHLRDDIVHANEALVADARARIYGEAVLERSQRDTLAADLAAVMAQAAGAVAACGSRHHMQDVAQLLESLRRTEGRALRLQEEGLAGQALRELASPGYRAAGDGLRTALREYIAHCSGSLEQVRARERAHELRSLAWSAAVFGICLGSWGLLLRRLEEGRLDMAHAEDVRLRAEAELRGAMRRYEALCAQAVEGILVVDPETSNILDANPAATCMLGCARDDLVGAALQRIDLGPADGAPPQEASAATVGAPAGVVQERLLRRPDGVVLTVEMRSSLVDAGPRSVLQCCLHDVTAGRKLAGRLEHAQRLECLGRVAGGVTHDLTNLLLAIKGYAALATDSDVAPAVHDPVARIGEAAEHGLSVSRSLLDFAGRGAGALEPVDLTDVVTRAARLLTPLLAADVCLEIDGGEGPCLALGDANRLQQVVVNLALNAAEAMPGGGGVRIAVESAPEAMPGAAAPEPACRIRVSDQGPGVPATLRNRVWEPFFTTKQDGSRHGLGLFNVRRIVADCGGDCRVEDAPGGGASFVVTLPAVTEPDGDRPDEGVSARVTLVEPQDFVRSVMAEALREAGFAVTALSRIEAGTVDEAPHCDLLVLDPKAGADALARLRATGWDGPAILTDAPGTAVTAMADAAGDALLILARPFAMEELCALATAALRPARIGLETAP
jgi:two-component system cell cycle sensor histidine kinase/response regulator CckA